MAELRWAGTLLIKDHPLVAIHICPCPYQEEIEMFQHGVKANFTRIISNKL